MVADVSIKLTTMTTRKLSPDDVALSAPLGRLAGKSTKTLWE